MLTEQEDTDLAVAVDLLESPNLGIRIANYIGAPIEAGLEHLPKNWRRVVDDATEAAIQKAFWVALQSLRSEKESTSSDWLHKGLATTSGAVGGYFGLAALTIELPITTVLILRSIADIARSEGEEILSPETSMACLEVFALGSNKTASDDAAETSYYAQRIALTQLVREAAAYVAKEGTTTVAKESGKVAAPVLVRLINVIAARFGIQVEAKVMAQLVPIIGAVGGAGVNMLFMDHYQSMARGHFIVRRLERIHGEDSVRQKYQAIAASRSSRKLLEATSS